MKASPKIPKQPAGLSPEKVRMFTSIGLVGDLLERGLQYSLGDLNLVLIQIADSGLLDSIKKLAGKARELANEAETLQMQVWHFYPRSTTDDTAGSAAYLLFRSDKGLLQEVEIYRQEHFWINERAVPLFDSEQLIEGMFRLYEDVELFMRMVDSFSEAGECERRHRAPERTPNPYGDIELRRRVA